MIKANADRMDAGIAEAVGPDSRMPATSIAWCHIATVNLSELSPSEVDFRPPRTGTLLGQHETARELAHLLLSEPSKKARENARISLVAMFVTSQSTVEAALIWMVLHSRPQTELSESVRASLVDEFNQDEVNWAMKTIIRKVFSPLMRTPRWIRECRLARRDFGFDFEDEAPSYLWEKIHRYKDHNKGLVAWMNTTLRNHRLEIYRKLKRSIGPSNIITPRDEKMTPEQVEAAFDTAVVPASTKKRPFKFSTRTMLSAACAKIASSRDSWGDGELAAMGDWDPLDAIIITIDTGLWKKIPSAIRNGWMKSCGVSVKSKVEAVLASPMSKRREALAEMLGITRNTLDKRWSRSVDRLIELSWVKFTMEAAQCRLQKKLPCE